nr:hypothetical protein [Methylorubrum zatmanii]
MARLAHAFNDPRVAGACGNIAIRNESASLWTGLQSVEYMMSISAGKSILDVVGAIACPPVRCTARCLRGKAALMSAPARISSSACGYGASVIGSLCARCLG